MHHGIDYGPAREDEIQPLAEVLSESFSFPAEAAVKRMESFGTDKVRVVRRQGRVVAGLWLVEMGQFFGGRSVPMGGVGAVGVAPEARGSGVALELMHAALAELHERGFPISTLYPATQTLYRKAGYEQAGGRYLLKMQTRDIAVRERALPVRAATEDDRPAVEEAYRAYARTRPGHLDRPDYIWMRVYTHKDAPTRGYLVEEEGRITGYVYFAQEKSPVMGYSLVVTDMMASTPGAARRLLGFLGDHRSLGRDAQWISGPGTPFLHVMNEQNYRLEHSIFWVTRMVNVPRALEARGYPEGLAAGLHLEVRDPDLAGNDGRFVLEVADGQGRVRPGGSGALRLGVRGLASLYAGFLSPWDLAAAGMLEGDEPTLARAGAVFAGPAPWMPDMF